MLVFTSRFILWPWSADDILKWNTRMRSELCFQLEHHGWSWSCVVLLPVSALTQTSAFVLFPHWTTMLCSLVHTHTHGNQSADYTSGLNLCNWSVGNKLHSFLNKGPWGIPHAVRTDPWHPDILSLHLSAVLTALLRADWIRKIHASIQLEHVSLCRRRN